MNGNLFWKEWKRHRTSLVLWTSVLSLFTILTMVFYPTIVQNANQIGSLLESPMMKSMLEMFGGGDVSSFTDILGFYATKNISTLLLLGSIFSIILASTIVAREENEKTADFLLTRPVTRTEVFLTKTVVWLSMVTVLNLVATGVGLLSLEIFKNDATQKVAITQEVTEHVVTGLNKNPQRIQPFFQPNDIMFDELMIAKLGQEMKSNQQEIIQSGISQEMLNTLSQELAKGPANIFQQVKADPERYMQMFQIPSSQRTMFLAQVEQAETEYLRQKEGFKNDPAVFVEVFKENPEYFLKQYSNDQEARTLFIREFGLNQEIVKSAYYAYKKQDYFVLSLYTMLVMIVFGAIGLFISILIRRGRPISNVAIGLVLAAYILDASSKIADQLEKIGYLSPFKYVDINVMKQGYGLESWRLAYLILVPLLLIVLSLTIYKKKDIII